MVYQNNPNKFVMVYQNYPNKFVMVYQNYPNKFSRPRALQTKHAEEVAYVLNNVFLTFGAWCALHTDNGRDFANLVNVQLQHLWRGIEVRLFYVFLRTVAIIVISLTLPFFVSFLE